MEFAGKVVLITGAARGIGAAAAYAFAEKGADVVINDIGPADEIIGRIQALGRRALYIKADVSEHSQVEAMAEKAFAEMGHVDIFVSNAVFSDRAPFLEQKLEGFRKTLDVTMMGAYYCLREISQRMVAAKIPGKVVIVSSPHAFRPMPSAMAYNMAKAAIDQMALTAAAELMDYNIHINVIYPGWINTPGERKFFSEDELSNLGSRLPLGRLANVDEIVPGILFLASPNPLLNGTSLLMDGGQGLPRVRVFA